MSRITKVISDSRVQSDDIKRQAKNTLEELFEKYGEDGKYFNENLTVIIEIIDEEEN